MRTVNIKVEFEIENLKTTFSDDELLKYIKDDIKENWETNNVIIKIGGSK